MADVANVPLITPRPVEQMEIEGQPRSRLTEAERRLLEDSRQQPNSLVTTRPPSLGYVSIASIIVNRMVGSGIFRTPTTLAQGTNSVGYSLVFWSIGAVVAVSGVLVFAEFGLTVPRLRVEDENKKESVPRNGGEKNYLEYMVRKPKYLATCVYGIPFVVLGNAAGNAIVFAENIMLAAGNDAAKGPVRGIAIGVITFACLLHALSRRAGIWVNNFFGIVKFVMLLVLFSLGVAYSAGRFGGSDVIAKQNLSVQSSFAGASKSSYGYVEAFLAIIFAIGGFNQANYVLGEIDDPRRKFKQTAVTTVSVVSILYVLVNISYMLVVSAQEQFALGDDTVAQPFFRKIFGDSAANQVLCAFIAFSSFGNIIVQTFTAARVKQEIAKEGVLPWSKFFASNYSPFQVRAAPGKNSGTRDDAETSSDTPIGALILHWGFSMILILASIPVQSNAAYRTYVNLYSFTIDAIFGFAVGLSLLILRWRGSFDWARKSSSNPFISISAALIFTVANAFPLVAVWIPPSGHTNFRAPAKWFLTGTVGMGLIAFAGGYWVVFRYLVPRVRGKQLEVEKEPFIVNEHGYWVMWHEIVSINWRV